MAYAFKTEHYSRLTVLPLTRHVKSMLNWCYVDINTASNVLSCNSNKNSKNNKEGFCALSCYCTKQVLCNKHFLYFLGKIPQSLSVDVDILEKRNQLKNLSNSVKD